MVNLPAIRNHVESMLREGLSKSLTYHGVSHTLDVTEQCLVLAREEGITDDQALLELQVAALYHDCGFIFVYNNHEEKGCEIARNQLPGFGMDARSIDHVCKLIMATKVPQRPVGHLQQIICDADLDYLGRDDFFETGNKLCCELIAYKFISGNHDWEKRQLDFLASHKYFTQSSKKKREPFKLQYIEQLLQNKATETK